MKKRNRGIIILEFTIWSFLVTFGIVALILNFVNGKIATGIIYSAIAVLSAGGLVFNIVYLLRHLEREDHLPKE